MSLNQHQTAKRREIVQLFFSLYFIFNFILYFYRSILCPNTIIIILLIFSFYFYLVFLYPTFIFIFHFYLFLAHFRKLDINETFRKWKKGKILLYHNSFITFSKWTKIINYTVLISLSFSFSLFITKKSNDFFFVFLCF